MNCLKHVPVWECEKMGGVNGIVWADKDLEGVGIGFAGKKV